MKSSDFGKVRAALDKLDTLNGDVNGAEVLVSFTNGKSAKVPMDKNLGQGYVDNQKAVLRQQLATLGVECD